MSSLFEMTTPWWEIMLRGTTVFIALLVLLRLSGKRTVGQFTPFDLLVLILIGDAVQGAMLGEDTSLTGGLVLGATLLGLNWLAGFIASRSKRVDTLLEGSPVLLARDGVVFRNVLERENLTDRDLDEAMREADCPSRDQIKLATLEIDGNISVVTDNKKS